MARRILVYADWQGLPEITQVGTLTAEITRGKEIFSFEYTPSWLQSPQAQMLDPDLQLYAGPQYLNDDSQISGCSLILLPTAGAEC